jgi:peptidyl-prolyl cis-trans isomerase B (cyclophilin B)
MKNPIVTIKISELGEIKIELLPEYAPNTVANFVSLIQSKFYDGLTFHRIIPGFMIQGGDPDGNGTGGPGYTIDGEFENNRFDNPIKHERGTISMARSFNRNSAGSQFFIMHQDYPSLDGQYAAFGKVIENIDLVDRIATIATNNEKPVVDIVIEEMIVDVFGENYNVRKNI